MSEVPVTEPGRWSSQCAGYVDMKVRKAQTTGGTGAEKKRLYQLAPKAGGSRAEVTKYIDTLERRLGLSALQSGD